MSSLFPIPRQARRQDFVAAAGQTVFGVAGFRVYDTADLRVRVRSASGHFRTLPASAWSATLSGPAPAYPIVMLAGPRAFGDVVRIDGARVAARSTDVTLAGTIRGAALEIELDRIAVTQQELRRDGDDIADGLGAIDDLRDALALDAFLALYPNPGALPVAGLAFPGTVPTLADLVDDYQLRRRAYVTIEDFLPTAQKALCGKSNGTPGNGIDESAALKAALLWCGLTGTALLITPGRHRCAYPIALDGSVATRPITVRWASEPVNYDFSFSPPDNPSTIPSTAPAGSWLYFDHVGRGLDFAPAYQLAGLDLQLAFMRNQPAPALGWTPTDADWDLRIANTRGRIDVVHLNSCYGVLWDNGGIGQADIQQRGQCFYCGIKIMQQYDLVPRLSQILFPVWSIHNAVSDFTTKNLIPLVMQGVDGSFIDKLFCIFMRIHVLITDDTGSHGNYVHSIREIYSDMVGYSSILYQSGSTGLTLNVGNATIHYRDDVAYVSPTLNGSPNPYYVAPASRRGYGIDLSGDNAKVAVGNLQCDTAPEGIARAIGPANNSVLSFDRIKSIGNGWNNSGLGAAAFTAAGTNILEVNGAIRYTPTLYSPRSNLFSGNVSWNPGVAKQRHNADGTGYRLYNDGLLENWGLTAGGDAACAFTIPYTGGLCTHVSGNVRGVNATNKGYHWGYDQVSATGFTARPRETSAGSTSISTVAFEWTARGYVPPT